MHATANKLAIVGLLLGCLIGGFCQTAVLPKTTILPNSTVIGGSSTPTYVSSTAGVAFPLAITSTGAGHFVEVFVIATTQPTAVSLGSQGLTKYATCTPTNYITEPGCIWYTYSATGSQTSVSVTGGSGVGGIEEFELAGTLSSGAIDQNGTCSVNNVGCAINVTPSVANEAVIANYACASTLGSITGSPTAFTHLTTDSNGNGAAVALSTGAVQETATSANTCSNGSAASGLAISVE
jgi:hypothetical protein